MKIPSFLLEALPTHYAFAHCDVPCGIYDVQPARIAAQTVLKMVQKLQEEPEPEVDSDESAISYTNSMVRFIWTKEEHARKCKEELLILWTDFFKPEHLERFPDLHTTFWQAAKLCSYNKQHVDKQKAEELVQKIEEIAEIFNQAKEDK